MARRDDPGHRVPRGHLSSRGTGESCAGQAAIETPRRGGCGQAQSVVAEISGKTGEQACAGCSGRRTLLVGDH